MPGWLSRYLAWGQTERGRHFSQLMDELLISFLGLGWLANGGPWVIWLLVVPSMVVVALNLLWFPLDFYIHHQDQLDEEDR